MIALALLVGAATARPAPDPVGWGNELPDKILAQAVTPNDYPIESLKKNEVGKATFGVVVGTDGTVKSCSILTSSGSETLDSRTCALMEARLRFNPAHDANGNAVEDRFWGRVNWVLNPLW